MSMNRRSFHRHLAATLGLGMATLATGRAGAAAPDTRPAGGPGRVYTSTNNAAGNELLVFGNDGSGTQVLLARVQTLGQGTSSGLGSQGAVTLSGDGRHLFVVNAGNHTLSSFAGRGGTPTLVSVVASGGLRPISVSEHEGLVYVVNADGDGNVAGFRNQRGMLLPLAGSVRPLSAAGGTAPAQVGIGTEGDVLVVTEKNTNRITSYALAADGSAGPPLATASSGPTPFGFTFDRRNRLLVSEAFGGAADASALSSYRFDAAAPALPVVVSRSVPTGQTAACWVVATPNGRFVYTANAGSGSVSQFTMARDGSATLVAGVAASTGANSGPVDMAISGNGRMLHVLAGRVATIFSFDIDDDGSLAAAGAVAGLPAGCVGLAA